NRLSYGIAASRGKRRGRNLAHPARLRVDLEDVDLAVIVRSGSLGAGHEDKVYGKGLRELGAGGDQRGNQKAGYRYQHKPARVVELHAHLSSLGPIEQPFANHFRSNFGTIQATPGSSSGCLHICEPAASWTVNRRRGNCAEPVVAPRYASRIIPCAHPRGTR